VLEGDAASPYAGGFYHGRVVFPPQYPFKPPSIAMMCARGARCACAPLARRRALLFCAARASARLAGSAACAAAAHAPLPPPDPNSRRSTPSGRFEPGNKICLSFSDFHPESWNPLWGVSHILLGVQSFFYTDDGTTGALRNVPDSEKKRLASASLAVTARHPAVKKLFPELVELAAARAGEAAEAEAAAAKAAAAAAKEERRPAAAVAGGGAPAAGAVAPGGGAAGAALAPRPRGLGAFELLAAGAVLAAVAALVVAQR
jgi:ubiquitin-conjugating enzyme E2 J2